MAPSFCESRRGRIFSKSLVGNFDGPSKILSGHVWDVPQYFGGGWFYPVRKESLKNVPYTGKVFPFLAETHSPPMNAFWMNKDESFNYGQLVGSSEEHTLASLINLLCVFVSPFIWTMFSDCGSFRLGCVYPFRFIKNLSQSQNQGSEV
jgi:hypothetical protein